MMEKLAGKVFEVTRASPRKPGIYVEFSVYRVGGLPNQPHPIKIDYVKRGGGYPPPFEESVTAADPGSSALHFMVLIKGVWERWVIYSR